MDHVPDPLVLWAAAFVMASLAVWLVVRHRHPSARWVAAIVIALVVDVLLAAEFLTRYRAGEFSTSPLQRYGEFVTLALALLPLGLALHAPARPRWLRPAAVFWVAFGAGLFLLVLLSAIGTLVPKALRDLALPMAGLVVLLRTRATGDTRTGWMLVSLACFAAAISGIGNGVLDYERWLGAEGFMPYLIVSMWTSVAVLVLAITAAGLTLAERGDGLAQRTRALYAVAVGLFVVVGLAHESFLGGSTVGMILYVVEGLAFAALGGWGAARVASAHKRSTRRSPAPSPTAADEAPAPPSGDLRHRLGLDDEPAP